MKKIDVKLRRQQGQGFELAIRYYKEKELAKDVYIKSAKKGTQYIIGFF